MRFPVKEPCYVIVYCLLILYLKSIMFKYVERSYLEEPCERLRAGLSERV